MKRILFFMLGFSFLFSCGKDDPEPEPCPEHYTGINCDVISEYPRKVKILQIAVTEVPEGHQEIFLRINSWLTENVLYESEQRYNDPLYDEEYFFTFDETVLLDYVDDDEPKYDLRLYDSNGNMIEQKQLYYILPHQKITFDALGFLDIWESSISSPNGARAELFVEYIF